MFKLHDITNYIIIVKEKQMCTNNREIQIGDPFPTCKTLNTPDIGIF